MQCHQRKTRLLWYVRVNAGVDLVYLSMHVGGYTCILLHEYIWLIVVKIYYYFSIQFTLDTNRAPPALTELFSDMLPPTLRQLSEIQRHAANTLTMDYYAQVQYLNTIIIVRKQ